MADPGEVGVHLANLVISNRFKLGTAEIMAM
jgi:hypothetical protein